MSHHDTRHDYYSMDDLTEYLRTSTTTSIEPPKKGASWGQTTEATVNLTTSALYARNSKIRGSIQMANDAERNITIMRLFIQHVVRIQQKDHQGVSPFLFEVRGENPACPPFQQFHVLYAAGLCGHGVLVESFYQVLPRY